MYLCPFWGSNPSRPGRNQLSRFIKALIMYFVCSTSTFVLLSYTSLYIFIVSFMNYSFSPCCSSGLGNGTLDTTFGTSHLVFFRDALKYCKLQIDVLYPVWAEVRDVVGPHRPASILRPHIQVQLSFRGKIHCPTYSVYN
jgi:hypothetical protein